MSMVHKLIPQVGGNGYDDVEWEALVEEVISQVDALHEDLGVITQESQYLVQGPVENLERQEDVKQAIAYELRSDDTDDNDDDDDYKEDQLSKYNDNDMFDMHIDDIGDGLETQNIQEDENTENDDEYVEEFDDSCMVDNL